MSALPPNNSASNRRFCVFFVRNGEVVDYQEEVAPPGYRAGDWLQ